MSEGNYRYRVTKPCYYQDVYRTPTKHNIVVVQEKFGKKEKPSYLELIPDNTAEIEAAAKAAKAAQKGKSKDLMTREDLKNLLTAAGIDFPRNATDDKLAGMWAEHQS